MSVSSRILCTVLCSVVMFQVALATSHEGWPYLQVYPPLDHSDNRTQLFFALMLSFGGDYTSIGALPGVQIALDYINSEPSILPGYSLHYTLTDSQVGHTLLEEWLMVFRNYSGYNHQCQGSIAANYFSFSPLQLVLLL